MKASCKECEDIILMRKESRDKQYYTVDGASLVVRQLNGESHKKKYNLRWDRNLVLRTPVRMYIGSPVNLTLDVLSGLTMEENSIPDEVYKYHLIPSGKAATESNEFKKTTIIGGAVDLIPYHLITVEGEVEKSVYVEADGKQRRVSEVLKELEEYMDSDEYVIGDEETNMVLDEDALVDGNMKVRVMRHYCVVIEMEEGSVLAVEVNVTKLAEDISSVTGIDKKNILITIEVDDEGYVVRVIITLTTTEMGELVVAKVNELVKDDECFSFVLCRSRRAYVLVKTESLSQGKQLEAMLLLEILIIFISAVITFITQ